MSYCERPWWEQQRLRWSVSEEIRWLRPPCRSPRPRRCSEAAASLLPSQSPPAEYKLTVLLNTICCLPWGRKCIISPAPTYTFPLGRWRSRLDVCHSSVGNVSLCCLRRSQQASVQAPQAWAKTRTQTMCFCFDFDLKEPRSLHADFWLVRVRLQKRSSHHTALLWSSTFDSPPQMFADISVPTASCFFIDNLLNRSRGITTVLTIK